MARILRMPDQFPGGLRRKPWYPECKRWIAVKRAPAEITHNVGSIIHFQAASGCDQKPEGPQKPVIIAARLINTIRSGHWNKQIPPC